MELAELISTSAGLFPAVNVHVNNSWWATLSSESKKKANITTAPTLAWQPQVFVKVYS